MSAIPKELFGLKVEVIRSRRKTSALHIIGNELQIRVPTKVRDRKIVEILEIKERWIRNKAIKLRNQPVTKEREFISGESFFLFGRCCHWTCHFLLCNLCEWDSQYGLTAY